MVDFLRQFSGEVTRVAVATGTNGILGQVANVEGVSGEWRNLTDSVNTMSSQITLQVRSIALATVSTILALASIRVAHEQVDCCCKWRLDAESTN